MQMGPTMNVNALQPRNARYCSFTEAHRARIVFLCPKHLYDHGDSNLQTFIYNLLRGVCGNEFYAEATPNYKA